ncbi:hypothetical protein PoB_004843400 [Plakobranchus ocellatus]|uniref:Uncharacterized protein n=1 Tax=Plakobranchus ocellatus TaxID=259542 RepID=A0AAV4BU85_9GAST|nr:hypothetical protein PoB_004843400 [Plakobranchus ocellatus]
MWPVRLDEGQETSRSSRFKASRLTTRPPRIHTERNREWKKRFQRKVKERRRRRIEFFVYSQGAGSGARTRDRRVPSNLRADSQATVLPTPPKKKKEKKEEEEEEGGGGGRSGRTASATISKATT